MTDKLAALLREAQSAFNETYANGPVGGPEPDWGDFLAARLEAAGVRVEPDYAGHRTVEPHDCFAMNCKALGREVESLRAALAKETPDAV